MHMNGGVGMICCRRATLEDLKQIWDYQIAQNPEEPRNQRRKDRIISRNIQNHAAPFVVVSDGEPIGEVTLDYYAEAYGNAANRPKLADGKNTGYVTALRIRKDFEGNGYISALMRFMEESARKMGFTQLTIGVEAAETRNLAIYLHWGYDKFILSEIDEGELVLFYGKALPSTVSENS